MVSRAGSEVGPPPGTGFQGTRATAAATKRMAPTAASEAATRRSRVTGPVCQRAVIQLVSAGQRFQALLPQPREGGFGEPEPSAKSRVEPEAGVDVVVQADQRPLA